jgi:glycosyltransferase involved in cell wall biosynthesis
VSWPLAEGVPHHILQVVQSLDAGRYEIDVVCPRTSTLWAGLDSRAGVRLHHVPPARRVSPSDLASWTRLVRLAGKADLIHAHSSKAGLLTRLAARARKRTEVCLFTPHAWSFWAARGVEARVYTLLERLAARWCEAIVVVSDHERSAGLSARIGTAEQYRVVRNGVPLDEFSAQPQPVPGRIVALGRLAPQKRPDLAVKAFAGARTRYPEAELHFVGEGPLHAEVEALIADLGLRGAVKLLGQRAHVPPLLARASCLLLASDYEGCPFSVLEAMAAGVPVVATRVGGVPELVDDGVTGLLAEAGDEEALAGALIELLADPTRAMRMGAAGRERARRDFSADRMVQRITELYEQIATSDSGDRMPRIESVQSRQA